MDAEITAVIGMVGGPVPSAHRLTVLWDGTEAQLQIAVGGSPSGEIVLDRAGVVLLHRILTHMLATFPGVQR
jgi:hypothetical protein